MIGAAQKVEHYEMAGYNSARSLAQAIGQKEAAQLLQETLKEENETDRKLEQISKRIVKEHGRSSPNGGEKKESRQASKRGASRNGGSSRQGSSRQSSRSSKATTDHEEIQRWAEERGAHPACVKGTGGKKDIGMLRLDFPGYSGEDKLQPISWDDFFKKFDERGLALVFQEKTARGQKSNFNKLVSRDSVGDAA
jgi:hypothetical protein